VELAIVRHADAGRRSDWVGDDRDRPLSPLGRAQAEALAERLAAAGVIRVRTSPSRRCRETVAPLAARLGIPLEEDERLGVTDGGAVPGAAGSLIELAGRRTGGSPGALESSGVVVLCTHGEVIARLLGDLAAAQGLAVPGEKAGIWWCSLDPSDGNLPVLRRLDPAPAVAPGRG